MNLQASIHWLQWKSQGKLPEGKVNRYLAYFPQEELGEVIKVLSKTFLSWTNNHTQSEGVRITQELPPVTSEHVLRDGDASVVSLEILI